MTLEERIAAFHARTEQYRRLGHDDFAAARFVAEAAGRLEGPALDVGTGKGLFAMALARRGLDVVSVDVNAEDSELAAALAGEAGLDGRTRFLLHDARSLPFPDGSFGCAAMMEVLHHLDDARPVLAEMARLVRPGGAIVVADFVEAGFTIVDSVYRADGREHPRSGSTLEGAKVFLSSLNWLEEGRTEAHHDAVAWFRQPNALSGPLSRCPQTPRPLPEIHLCSGPHTDTL
jgi:ubiquinone/menaquinone biosynthesis C-methylase UbiE